MAIDTTYLDSDTDSIMLARPAILAMAKKANESVSVKDFGAVGDGVTDDTAAIQAALDYAATSALVIITNKVNVVTAKVLMPSGVYKTSAPLLVGEGTLFEGDSPSTSIIKPTHTGIAIQMGGNSREYSQIKILRIGIIGNWSGAMSYGAWTTTTSIGIYVENCIRECYILDCFVTQCNTSIKVENSYAFEINNNYLVYAKTNHIEWDVAVNGTIQGNRIDWAENTGIYLNGGASALDETIGVLISGNAIQICWRDGVKLYDCSTASLINNFFESNYREAVDGTTHVYADINIVSGPYSRGYSYVISGNFFTSGSSPAVDAYTAIRCDRAVSLVVIGNTCRSSLYWRFIDAANVNVERIIALGNSYEGTFTKIAYDSTTCFGLMEEQSGDGEIYIPSSSAGSVRVGVVVSSSNQTSSSLKTLYLLNCTGGNRQLTLREVDCVAGRMYTIKKTDSGANLLLAVPEADGSPRLIDGAANSQTAAAYGVIRVVSDGTNWFTI